MNKAKIIGYEKTHVIFESGDVWSVARSVVRKNGTVQRFKDKKLTARRMGNGYYLVRINIDGKSIHRSIHSLLAESFILKAKIPKGMCVNHKDGNKGNNVLSNLEIVSYRDNLLHAYKTGLNSNIGQTHPKSRITTKQIEVIRGLYRSGVSQYLIASQFNVCRATIQGILNGRSRKSG